MSFRPNVRRVTTVSGAVLALCLGSGGIAAADVLPAPIASATTDPVGTVQQTVTTLSTALSPTPTGSPTPAPTSPLPLPALPVPLPTSSPAGTTATSPASAPGSSTTVDAPRTSGSVSKAATTVRRTTTRTGRVATPAMSGGLRSARMSALIDAPSTASYSYAASLPSLALPPVRGVAAQNDAAAPAVAPLLMAPAIQHVNPLAGITGTDSGGFPLRGLALALAVAAAGGLAFEHLRLVARRVGS